MLANVKVDPNKLLDTLRENRAKHQTEYDTAVAAYREKAEKALRKRALDVRDGKTLSVQITNLPEPKSFADDYDRAIEMILWSKDDEIVLTERDFRAFVLDEWEWNHAFLAATSIYNGSI